MGLLAAAVVGVCGAWRLRGAATTASAPAAAAPVALDSLASAYCNLTVPKMTWAVSDTATTSAWLRKYLPVQCEETPGFSEYSLCSRTDSTCGSYVRLALNGSNEGHVSPCFGLHLVHAAKRPAGETSVAAVERHFDTRAKAIDDGVYDAFLDYSLVLYANSLDSYVDALAEDDVSFLLLRWKDNCDCVEEASSDAGAAPVMVGRTFFSLVVHVPGTTINLELVSAEAPSQTKRARDILDDATVRLPHTAVGSGVTGAPVGDNYLTPIAISKATTDIDALTSWYDSVLMANSDSMYEYADDSLTLRTLQLHGAPMPIRVIERASSDSSYTSFGLAELEASKNAAHASAWESATCGVDQFMDNHYALQQYRIPVDTFTDALMATDNYWHCNKDGIGNVDVYAVEPTGDVVQLNGDITTDGRTTLRELGCYNTSNILFHLCSEGRCGEKWIENDDLPTEETTAPSDGGDGAATGDATGDATSTQQTTSSSADAGGEAQATGPTNTVA